MPAVSASPLDRLLVDIAHCRACALPHEPRPVVQAASGARLLIVGQAPGRRVHETGIPWNDPSGERLREWLQLPPDRFYDPGQVAIVPMGFCYPGKGASGDLPPRPECAPLWHAPLLASMPCIRLTLLIGRHAQAWYLKNTAKATLAATVAAYAEYLPRYFPLPHPSPRNRFWLRTHAWFESEVVPQLRQQVAMALAD
ncbi:uracil-DNA glycosylase family protein [Cupriavidus sp. IDO]|uniref:uracil-DNA glycosylase family protein n=1 Tax=Cupriavidus sp. IDO TaxID=1539142 RepID=UPI0005791F99|nr:uracil-DNA glycosylase family protein [Cupriavidus sp. IDO]KWR75030.1 uracil-DNA glycosylase [Cupriavidus sp. IDO]